MQATAAWSVLGVFTGIIMATGAGCEVIDFVAYITAGLIVLLPVGVVAGLLIGRGCEAFAGGMTGLLAATVAAPPEPSGFFLLLIWSLMMGAVIGTTGWPIARFAARILGALGAFRFCRRR